MRVKGYSDLLLLNIATILLALIVVFLHSNAIRIVVGLPVMLFIPGYTLIAALFPGRGGPGKMERVVLSLGFSIAVVSLIGIILNYTPAGISLYPALISLVFFIVVISLVAWYRRRRLAESNRIALSPGLALISWRGQKFIDRVLSIIVIVAVLGAIGVLGYAIARPGVGERYTEFYALGQGDMAEGYPEQLTVGEEAEVTIGIINHEHQEMRYRIEIIADGVSSGEVGEVVLDHEEKHEVGVGFIPGRAGDKQKVEFLLYRSDQDEPYRGLHFRVDVVE